MYEIDNTYATIENGEYTIGEIGSSSKKRYCFFIGSRNGNRIAYKYMDLGTAMLCIKHGTIRFAQPDTWPDKYEGRFYNADYSNVTREISATPKLYATCITFTSVSEAAWNTYTYNKSGLGARCVQFKFDKYKFRAALESFAKQNKKPGYKIYEGSVSYNHSDYHIDNLHQKGHPLYEQYFCEFSLKNYLNLLLIKRPAFKYEEEYRFFIIPNDQNDLKDFIDVPINWKNVIKEIRVDERCSDVEIEAFIAFCHKYDINESKIVKLDLHQNPQPYLVIE